MREDRDAARAVDHRDRIPRGQALLFDIGRRSFCQKPVEGILYACGITLFNQEPREVRPPHYLAAGKRRHLFIVNRNTEPSELTGNLRVSVLSGLPEVFEG